MANRCSYVRSIMQRCKIQGDCMGGGVTMSMKQEGDDSLEGVVEWEVAR